jgi:hypothetical protein
MAWIRIPNPDAPPKTSIGKFFYDSSLSLAAFALFFLSLVGHVLSGANAYNQDNQQHGRLSVTIWEYLRTGHFLGSLFENWQSEFLQMALFVWLTVYLRQRGSSESKDPDEPEPVDDDPREKRDDPNAPWPVRRGGIVLALYEHSLSLALLALFITSWWLHAAAGYHAYSAQEIAHGEPQPSFGRFLSSAEFWFQTFQNWQSEFLSVGVLIVLSIFLRERGSAQSKPVAAAHAETGD